MGRITKQSSITLVELPATQFGVLNGDLSGDIYSRLMFVPRALGELEALLRGAGWHNVQTITPQFNYPKGKLSEGDLRRIFISDALLLSALTRTSPQSLQLARLYKLNNPDGIVMFGGSDSKFRAEDYLRDGADIVVMGEGEATLVEVMQRLEDSGDLSGVRGIAYKKNEGIVIEEERKLLTSEELSNLPHPIYDKRIRDRAIAGVIETTRGCPHRCEFCTVTQIYGNKYRTKSIDYSIEELRRVKDMGRVLFFTDDNFAANPNHAEEFLEEMIAQGFGNMKKSIQVQITAKAYKHTRLLKLMRKVGIDTLYVGIESVNDTTLNEAGKASDANENLDAVRTFREYGFWVHGMLMPGFDSDTPEILDEMSEFSKRNLDSVQYFPPGPLVGTPFYDRMEREGRILTRDYSLYDGQHVFFRPNHFSPYYLQNRANGMTLDFYRFSESAKRLMRAPKKIPALAIMAFTLFGGIRRILNEKQSLQHLEFLKAVS